MPFFTDRETATADLIEHLRLRSDTRGVALLARVLLIDVHEVRSAADQVLKHALYPGVAAGDDDALSPSSSPGASVAAAEESPREPAKTAAAPELDPAGPTAESRDDQGGVSAAPAGTPPISVVRAWLAANPGPHAVHEVVDGCDGLTRDVVRYRLKRLVESGDVEVIGRQKNARYAIAGTLHIELPAEEPRAPQRDITTFGQGRSVGRRPRASGAEPDLLERRATIDQEIAAVLEDGKPRTAQELARTMLRNFQEVHLRLQAGAAQRDPDGLWTLAPKEVTAHA